MFLAMLQSFGSDGTQSITSLNGLLYPSFQICGNPPPKSPKSKYPSYRVDVLYPGTANVMYVNHCVSLITIKYLVRKYASESKLVLELRKNIVITFLKINKHVIEG